jgi:hypothetical protein
MDDFRVVADEQPDFGLRHAAELQGGEFFLAEIAMSGRTTRATLH